MPTPPLPAPPPRAFFALISDLTTIFTDLEHQEQVLRLENIDLRGRLDRCSCELDSSIPFPGPSLLPRGAAEVLPISNGNSGDQNGLAHIAKSDGEEAMAMRDNSSVGEKIFKVVPVHVLPDETTKRPAYADAGTYDALASPEASINDQPVLYSQEIRDFRKELFKIYNMTKHRHLSNKIPLAFTQYTGVDAGRILELEGWLLKRRLQCDLLLQLVHSKAFLWLINFVILLNLLLIVAECDYNVRKSFKDLAGEDYHTDAHDLSAFFDASNVLFAAALSFEVILRIVAEEFSFCIGKFWKMNLFDLFLVIMYWCELALGLIGVDLTQARLLRVLRLTKALKGVRVLRFFKDLRVIFDSFMHILSPLMCSGLVLLSVILFFSIIFVQVVTDHIGSHGQDPMDHDKLTTLEKYYGSLPMAMFGLFMSLTGGESWWYLVMPLTEISVAYGLIFVVYIVLVQLGVLNIITSLFVEQAAHFTEKDTGNMQVAHAEHNTYIMQQLGKIFDLLDDDGDEAVSYAEFEKWSHFPESKAFFKTILGIETWMLRRLFKLMDVNDSGLLDRGEFIMGCMRLSGCAANMDMQAIRKDLKQTKKNTYSINRELNRILKD